MPISNILVSDFITELSAVNSDFSALTEAQQLQRINAAWQEISDLANAAGKLDFHVTTLAGGIISPVVGADNIRAGALTCGDANVATPITFTSPLVGDYVVTVFPAAGVGIDAPEAGWTASGFTAYGSVDNAAGYYIAVKKA